MPFVGAALRQLRAEVDNQAAVLGFVGAPFTLASYIVEGGSSKNFANLKRMAFSAPETLHALNSKLAESIADYVRYQVQPLAVVRTVVTCTATDVQVSHSNLTQDF